MRRGQSRSRQEACRVSHQWRRVAPAQSSTANHTRHTRHYSISNALGISLGTQTTALRWPPTRRPISTGCNVPRCRSSVAVCCSIYSCQFESCCPRSAAAHSDDDPATTQQQSWNCSSVAVAPRALGALMHIDRGNFEYLSPSFAGPEPPLTSQPRHDVQLFRVAAYALRGSLQTPKSRPSSSHAVPILLPTNPRGLSRPGVDSLLHPAVRILSLEGKVRRLLHRSQRLNFPASSSTYPTSGARKWSIQIITTGETCLTPL
ncbi:hypothetical protein B0T25DRAFT_258506 [Lasiosphaeria hispida]|uniref:Uncharacterized protein n=1 Tax=Lasiosphaeria hispida TaxID=260671 RepID=A0AAJ0MDA5_9PEZI|nr:hypothetical protein B0T25DRAFT_258506 [Lasiosphaeria hispida]